MSNNRELREALERLAEEMIPFIHSPSFTDADFIKQLVLLGEKKSALAATATGSEPPDFSAVHWLKQQFPELLYITDLQIWIAERAYNAGRAAAPPAGEERQP